MEIRVQSPVFNEGISRHFSCLWTAKMGCSRGRFCDRVSRWCNGNSRHAVAVLQRTLSIDELARSTRQWTKLQESWNHRPFIVEGQWSCVRLAVISYEGRRRHPVFVADSQCPLSRATSSFRGSLSPALSTCLSSQWLLTTWVLCCWNSLPIPNQGSLNQRNMGPSLPMENHKKTLPVSQCTSAHSHSLDLKHRNHIKSLEGVQDSGKSSKIDVFLVFLGPPMRWKNWRKTSMKDTDNGGSSRSFYTLPHLCVHARVDSTHNRTLHYNTGLTPSKLMYHSPMRGCGYRDRA